MSDGLRHAARVIGDAAIVGGRLLGRGLKWVVSESTIDTGGGPRRVGDVVDNFKKTGKVQTGGTWEPIVDMMPGESQADYLRRKHNEDMGGNYGRHEDLIGQAYVKDRHGNLKPYNPGG